MDHFLIDTVLIILLFAIALEFHMPHTRLSDSEILWGKEEESLTDTYDVKIPGGDTNVVESYISTAKEIFTYLISNLDAVIDEESMKGVMAIHEKLKQEKEKKT